MLVVDILRIRNNICVNHVLLSAVEFDGLLGNPRALIRSYMSDRYRPNSTNKLYNVVPPYFFK
jgi:hypothetical protein